MIGARPTSQASPSKEYAVMSTQDQSSADIFAEYHRHDRRRGGVVAAVGAAVLLVVGAFAVFGVASGSGQQAEAGTTLTLADFSTTTTAAQLAAKTFHIAGTMTSYGTTTTVDGSTSTGATPADLRLSMTVTLPDFGEGEVRRLGTTVYFNAGERSQGKFIAIDLADTTNPLNAVFSELFSSSDPSQFSTLPAGAVVSFEPAGPAETMDGVQATPYTLVVDTAALVAATGADGADAAALPARIEYRLWIGPDDLPRRITFDAAGTTVDMAFSAWGQPVTIEAPPADQTTTLDALAGG
jgi:hypothetical protein